MNEDALTLPPPLREEALSLCLTSPPRVLEGGGSGGLGNERGETPFFDDGKILSILPHTLFKLLSP